MQRMTAAWSSAFMHVICFARGMPFRRCLLLVLNCHTLSDTMISLFETGEFVAKDSNAVVFVACVCDRMCLQQSLELCSWRGAAEHVL